MHAELPSTNSQLFCLLHLVLHKCHKRGDDNNYQVYPYLAVPFTIPEYIAANMSSKQKYHYGAGTHFFLCAFLPSMVHLQHSVLLFTSGDRCYCLFLQGTGFECSWPRSCSPRRI
ncbi:unnamed protein product [Boreogadus saida]